MEGKGGRKEGKAGRKEGRKGKRKVEKDGVSSRLILYINYLVFLPIYLPHSAHTSTPAPLPTPPKKIR